MGRRERLVSGAGAEALAAPALEMAGVVCGYADVSVTAPIDLAVGQGSVLGIVGPNGAGKTTILRTIMGLARAMTGTVLFRGRSLEGEMWERSRLGISLVAEGRELFNELSVEENIRAGAARLQRREREAAVEGMWEVFPQLEMLRRRQAGVLSGGEQQMLALARGVVGRPSLLLLDEPSLGLAPRIIADLIGALGALREREGLSVLIVEQSLTVVRAFCDSVSTMSLGRVSEPGTVKSILSEEYLREGFLGA